jgi:hypothetical protein
MKPPWWVGIPAIEVGGPPGAEEHRLAWRDGELELLAHGDPDADLALGALGGGTCPCLELLAAWRADHEEGAILVTGARHPGERLRAPVAALDAMKGDIARWRGAVDALRGEASAAEDGERLGRIAAVVAPVEAAARRRLASLLLLALDAQLQVRLQGSVAAALAGAGGGACLAVATFARVRPSARALGWSDDGRGLELPEDWIASVWARGLADAVDGHLVVDVTSVTEEGAAVVVAAAPGKPRIEFRVDRWENA